MAAFSTAKIFPQYTFLSYVYGTSTSFHSTLSYLMCMAPPHHSTVHFPILCVWHLHIIPQYTFLSYVYGTATSFHSTLSYLMCMAPPNHSTVHFPILCVWHRQIIHNIRSCVTLMVAPLIIQQNVFHAASVFNSASVFMPCNNFAHHVEVVVLSASVSANNALPFHGCDCVQRCHAI